jgi:hypothetical protein
MKVSIKVYLRTDVKPATGLFPVYMRVIIDRQKKEYSLGVAIPKNLWDVSQIRVKKSLELPFLINLEI